MVVVMSGSMEPGYYRGDVLFLHARPEYPVEVGDIIVYRLPARDVPIVHRVHRVHVRESDSKRLFLTKGDNNMYDDRVIYDEGTEWVEEDFIIGKSYGYIPRLGYITLMFNESRICKILTLFLLGFFAITANDT
ncbi:signal peptidase protein, endoplasmic reticulum-type [Angomonas deanei]|nr:signal peptidase protein, endoplasmic reticulum-type [Angomonas deanei]|eukprot:EPY39744.1 signal peptidase protein, endoplasmic reticulum-type [Angomonas deanei]